MWVISPYAILCLGGQCKIDAPVHVLSKFFVFPSRGQDVEFEGRLAVSTDPHEVGWTTWDGEPNQERGDG